MLRISKLTDYGLVLLIEMAHQPGQVCNPAGLAARLRIPAPTVGKLLKQLAAGGLLISRRGVKGGYRLARPPESISLAQILAVLEGPLAVTECTVGAGVCLREHDCSVRDNWQRINSAIYRVFDQLSLGAMAQPLAGDILPLRLQNNASPNASTSASTSAPIEQTQGAGKL